MIVNGKRALAYTQSVSWIKPIEGADNIELIGVLGWTLIAKKGEFNVGDPCVYFEIDSKLPEKPWSEFLRPKHFKVKTMKLGRFGVFSQGLALPISAFEGINIPTEPDVDLTDLLGVKYSSDEDNERKANKANKDKKYQSMAARHVDLFKKKPIRWMMRRNWGRKILFIFFGKKRDNPRSFPTKFPFIKKTDEDRIENLPNLLGYEAPLIVTEKLDGTSSTYILERKGKRKFEYYVCSRNIRQADENQKCYHDHNIYWDMSFKYGIQEHLEAYLNENPDCPYVCIQGESVGSVQGNPLKLTEDDLYIFNFIDGRSGRMSSLDGKAIIEGWGMKWVPILDTNFKMPAEMEEFKAMATAKSVVNPNVMREGIVCRDPVTDLSFKNVSREYLLKHDG